MQYPWGQDFNPLAGLNALQGGFPGVRPQTPGMGLPGRDLFVISLCLSIFS